MRIISLATACAALAACAGEAEVPDEQIPADAETTVDPVVGSYLGVDDEGVEWTGTLRADGTTEVTVEGEIVETGTWHRADDDRICFVRDVEEGEEPDQENCYSFANPDANGVVEVTSADGEIETVTKVL